jgi:hypothetical protein
VRKEIENLLREQVNPDSLPAALGQMEAAEALSVYRLMDIHVTKLRLDAIAS